MGYDTDFYGKLKFTRRLTEEELGIVKRITRAGELNDDPEAEEAVLAQAKRCRTARGGTGPLVFDPSDSANLRADSRVYLTGDGLCPHYARDLRISYDGSGLVYCSEKSYDLVAGVNFIIANGRLLILGFGLKGSLFGDTEFEPYHWLLKIGEDGLAHQEPCEIGELWSHSKREYLRRKKFQVAWELHRPVVTAARRHRKATYEGDDGSRGAFRNAIDAACFRFEAVKTRCSKAVWNWRFPALKV